MTTDSKKRINIEDDENQSKKKKAREKCDHKRQLFEKSFTEREDIGIFLFNFDDILNYKSKNDASTSNTHNDEKIEDSSTESKKDENDKDNASNNKFNIRDEKLDNGNFDLQKFIDYFVNQLQVKYFMKIRQELNNDNPKIKIGYYDLGFMHKESNCIKIR